MHARAVSIALFGACCSALAIGCAGGSSSAVATSTTTKPTPSGAATPADTRGGTPTRTLTPAELADSIMREPFRRFRGDFDAASAPMLASGNYLGIVQLLEGMRAETPRDVNVQHLARELTGTYSPFVGQLQEALEAYAFEPPPTVRFDSVAVGRLAPEDAVDGVARLATNRQIVFLNELPFIPRDRAFAANLLAKLRPLGFSYLAIEALDERDTSINTRGYPVHASGFYVNEPVFGELVRTALKLGFKVVPYDAPNAAGDARESGQAQRLVDRVLKSDPKARIVVYASEHHIDESGTIDGAKPMAVHFRELTGIDPLTVDQTVLTERADTTFDDNRYLFLMKRVRRQVAFVLKQGDSLWSAQPGTHDVTVVHPRAVHRAGRPSWLYALGNRRAYLLSDEICGGVALDCVVTARIATENEDAIPVDALRIQFSAPGSKTFALPPGKYVVEAHDGTGAALSRQTLTIPAR